MGTHDEKAIIVIGPDAPTHTPLRNRLADVLDLDIAILKRMHMGHEIETIEKGTSDCNPVSLGLRASEEARLSLQTDGNIKDNYAEHTEGNKITLNKQTQKLKDVFKEPKNIQ